MTDLRPMNERLMTPGRPPRVLFCGSRDGWPYRSTACAELIRPRIEALPDGSIVVTGGARGADLTAHRLAESRGLHVAVIRPLSVGGRVGPLARNDAMLSLLDPEHDWVEAFFSGPHPHRSNGTRYTVIQAERLGVPVNSHWLDGTRQSSSGLRERTS
jgi:hypothetical protein